ncbi:Ectopic P granules protein 5 [Podila epicladia]|nr:Ectopic P granules protein 5 [Podila epicladia]
MDSEVPSLFPTLPPPPTSTKSYTFQPSAPPSAPPLTPSAAPTAPTAPSFPPAPTLYPQSHLSWLQEPDSLPPWRSTSPTTDYLHTPLSEPSAPPSYPALHGYNTSSPFYPRHDRFSYPQLNPYESSYPQLTPQAYAPAIQGEKSLYPAISELFTRAESGLSPEQLDALYHNQCLDDLPDRLIAFFNRSSGHTQDSRTTALYEHTRSYEVAYEAVQQSKLAIFGLQQKAKGYASKLWTVQTKSDVVKATCGDGATISHTFSYQVGKHDSEVAAKLKKSLNRAFKQRTKSLVKLQYEEASCRLWIQEHISEFLNTVTWDKSAPGIQQFTATHIQGLEQIKEYLDVLFQFERSVRRQPDFDPGVEDRSYDLSRAENHTSTEQSNSIIRSIHDWIILLGTTLLEHGGVIDQEYLVLQVVQSSHFTDWSLAALIQCEAPKIWTNTFQDNYLTTLQLVLCGIDSIRPTFLSESLANIKVGSTLGEDDYLAILDQMDVALFFNRLLVEHKEMHSQDGTLYQKELSERTAFRLLAATHHLFKVVIFGLQRLTKFSVVSKRIAQLLCQLSQILGDHLLVLGPISSNRQQNKEPCATLSLGVASTTIQLEVDLILMKVTETLVALPGHGLWTFIPSIPFKFMSTSVLALKLRHTIGRNPGEAIFLLNTLAAMATSRYQDGPSLGKYRPISLEDNLTSVIIYLLLDAAFLDGDIRGELSKPTREILGSVCDTSPEAISFILSFVEHHFKDMGDMAQYLFRELPLDEWTMTAGDFIILKKFLEVPPLSSQQSMFARYTFSHLAWSNDGVNGSGQSRAKVSPGVKKEIALVLADICTHYINNFSNEPDSLSSNPPTGKQGHMSPETKFASTFTSSLPHAVANLAAHSGLHLTPDQAVMKSFMDWCWSMLLKLRLPDLPPLSVVEASRLHVPDPGLAKYPMFSQGQLTFVNTVHLLLTSSSRDPDQFLADGWTTLISILHSGASQVLLELLAILVPPIVFSVADVSAHTAKFGLLFREMAGYKQDPLLATAGKQFAGSHHLPPNSASADLVGISSVIQAHLEYGESQSYGDSIKKVLQFWLSAVFSQKDWMAHQEYVQVLDVVCMYCFELGLDGFIKDALTEQQILLSIGFRRSPGMSAELMGLAQPSLDRVMDMLPSRLLKALPVPQGSSDPSLLMGTWSVKSFATTLITQQAMVETNSIWFAYYALLTETHLERDMRIKIGTYYHQHPAELKVAGNIKTVMKTLGVTSRKTLQNFAIWRWAQHLLILPFDTYLLPLFWQSFFYLYFGHVEQRDLFYGYKFLETNSEIVEQLKERLQKTYTYFGQEARKAIQNQDAALAESLTGLNEFYIALYGWISEPLLLTTEVDLKRIRKDLMPQRLVSCRLSDPQEFSPGLWRELLHHRTNGTKHSSDSPPRTPTDSPLNSNLSSIYPHKKSVELPASTRSYGQSRIIRKHSHAWQEKKISNCLVKQAKPRPDLYIPRLAVMLPVVSEQSTAQSLLGQSTKAVKAFCRAYQDTNEAYENLDTSYLSELAALYHNEVKTSRLEIACDSTPTSLCKRPAVVELKYEEIVVNDKVKLSIVENRERAKALRLGSIHPGLCIATMEISKVVGRIMELLSSQESSSSDETSFLRRLAISIFFYLHSELLEDAREYPPTHLLLNMIVESLGMEIVAKDSTQTEAILDLMGTDDFRITLLCKTFYPAALTSEFVRLYKRIATCKDYGLASKDQLLRQFDVQAWALEPIISSEGHDGPSVLDRLAFYEVAFTAMVVQQQQQSQDDQIQESTELSTRDRLAIIKSHRELAGTLFVNFLQQDYVEYLRILFDTCGTMCLEPEVLEDFIRILGVEPRLVPGLLDGGSMDEAQRKGSKSMTTLGLSDYDLGCLVKFLAEYFTKCQNQMVTGNLLDRFSNYAVSIANLFTVILCDERYLTRWMKSFAESVGYSTSAGIDIYPKGSSSPMERQSVGLELVNMSQCRIWSDTLMVFEPWLSCLTNRAVDEIQFQRQQSGASRMLFTFVGIVSKMMDAIQHHYHDHTVLLTTLFDLYLDLTEGSTAGRGSINQTMLIHQHFHRLEWKGLEWTQSQISRIIQVASKITEETRIEFWTYLVTVVMDKADCDLRPRRLDLTEWHQTEAIFLNFGLTVLQDVHLVAGNDLVIREHFLERLWAVIFDVGDWTLMDQAELKRQVDGIKVHWEVVGPWDSLSTPLGMLLHWMRIAVGLEKTDLKDFEGELDSQDQLSTTEDIEVGISVERVLIYFGFVTQLVQARLASSAEDSQSVNFRMGDIPFVITHLGQVLDRIAADRLQSRHPQISRALSLLVGVLNKCGKGPRSLSSLSSSSPGFLEPFETVFCGLKRMISEVEVIQLDVVRAVCQKVNSIPAMVNLLEESIEREFYLWEGKQGSTHGNHQRSSSSSSSLHGSVSVVQDAAAVFGLEDTSSLQMMSPMPMIGHQARFIRSGGGGVSAAGRESWIRIKNTMEAPELSEDEFLDQALKQGSILAIHGLFLQRLESCEASQEFDEVLELGQELAEVISKVELLAIEPWKAYQSLLLLRMFLNLVAKESVHSVLQSRFLTSVIQVCQTLELWCQDRDTTKGMLSSIGMGTRSSFDTKFRLVVRIIYTYLVVRLADKGVSIHQGINGTAPGGVMAWRRGRHNSGGETGLSTSGPTSGQGSKRPGDKKDVATQLIDTLVQLPVKNKDYALIFMKPPQPQLSAAGTMPLGSSLGPLAVSSLALGLISSSSSSFPSPLDIVKRTILPSSASSPSSSPKASVNHQRTVSASTIRTASSPKRGYTPNGNSNDFSSSAPSSGIAIMGKQTSVQSHHSRFSTGGSWDDSAGSLLLYDRYNNNNKHDSSSMAPSLSLVSAGLMSTKRKYYQQPLFPSGLSSSSASSLYPTEQRLRLQYGTRHEGMEDFEWAVQQVKDRRFRILEAAEVLTEVMDRFYDDDDYFA